MIDLTPLEVRQKKGDFRSSFRGYDAELVNDFLDLVADRMEELVKRNMELGDTVESLEEELEEYRTKERALSDALMTAQKLREDARSHADKEGELLIREARLEAENAHREASRALAREEQALRQVQARRAQLVASFRRLLEREMGELDVIEETLELEAAARPRVPATSGAPGSKVEAGKGEESEAASTDAEPAGAESPEADTEADVDADVKAASAEEPSADAAAEESPGEGKREASQGPADTSADTSDGAKDEATEVQDDWLKSLVEE